eukprot:49383-Eustigmatos_ZCMA.PRE.1
MVLNTGGYICPLTDLRKKHVRDAASRTMIERYASRACGFCLHTASSTGASNGLSYVMRSRDSRVSVSPLSTRPWADQERSLEDAAADRVLACSFTPSVQS